MDRPLGYRDPNPNGTIRDQGFPNLSQITVTDDGHIENNGQMVDGALISIDEDGNTVVDYKPAPAVSSPVLDDSFGTNLAEVISDDTLDKVARVLLEGISNDEMSRSGWVQTYTDAIDLLGIGGPTVPSQEKGTRSTVRHPVLLEACVRTQSTIRAELLPSMGPCKTVIDGDETGALDQEANTFQDDVNHYLTVTATEYYPDFDRGLFNLCFSGTLFRKGYHCPLRKRPVIESVYGLDLIVSNDATDLQNALRVTHRIKMIKSEVIRMMLAEQWREVDLQLPTAQIEPVDAKIKSTEGLNPYTQEPRDAERTIYECYTEWDFGSEVKRYGAPKGLPLPYRITIDKDSQKVLEIRRDWKQGDKLFRRRRHFVKYGMVPALGFYDLGYLHLIGQQARALTAIWRILIDAGMYANFPGGVKIKGTRQTTSEINPGPGEWIEVDTGAAEKIQDALMPLPYKEPSAVLLEMSQAIEGQIAKVAQSVQQEVGEGRTNIPVGTIMSQIEQQTQIMQAVHKRLHTAQAEELMMLKDLLSEDPGALSRFESSPTNKQWRAEEFKDEKLVPMSDPNVPAQIHRVMQATALATLATQMPQLFNVLNVARRLLTMINIADVDALLASPEQVQNAGGGDQAKAQADQAKAQAQQVAAQASVEKSKVDLQKAQIDQQTGMSDDKQQLFHEQVDAQMRREETQAGLQEARIKQETEMMKIHAQTQQKMAEHQLQMQSDKAQRAHEQSMAHQQAQLGFQQSAMDHQHETQMAQGGFEHESQMADKQTSNEREMASQEQQHEAGMAKREQVAENRSMATTQAHESKEAAKDRKVQTKPKGGK